ncbi:hypothetical protein BJY59DRAFT_704308 [Rhodotorula toruloides]
MKVRRRRDELGVGPAGCVGVCGCSNRVLAVYESLEQLRAPSSWYVSQSTRSLSPARLFASCTSLLAPFLTLDCSLGPLLDSLVIDQLRGRYLPLLDSRRLFPQSQMHYNVEKHTLLILRTCVCMQTLRKRRGREILRCSRSFWLSRSSSQAPAVSVALDAPKAVSIALKSASASGSIVDNFRSLRTVAFRASSRSLVWHRIVARVKGATGLLGRSRCRLAALPPFFRPTSILLISLHSDGNLHDL